MSEAWVIRKNGAFYRDNYCGYTTDPCAAGVYTREQAEAEAAHEPKAVSAHRLSDWRDQIWGTMELAKARLALIDHKISACRPSEDK